MSKTMPSMTADEQEALLASVTPPACPAWCTDKSTDHTTEYAGVEPDGALVRYHSFEVNSRADVAQRELYRVGPGAVLEPPYVAAFVSDNEHIDAATARLFAANIAAAADKLDEITAAHR